MTKVTTGFGRLSFPSLITPRPAENEGEKPKYEVTFLFPKSDKETLRALKAAIKTATEEGKSSLWNGRVPANLRTPLKDGEEKAEDYPEFAGMYYIAARGTIRPGLVDADLEPVLEASEVYPGRNARIQVSLVPYSHPKGGKGVTAVLKNVQLAPGGDPIGSSANDAPEVAFGRIESTDASVNDDLDDDLDDDLL